MKGDAIMKKIVCLVLAIMMLSSVVFATQLNDEQKTDLYNFGIMTGDENGDLRLNDTITRAEAVKIICTAGNIPVVDINASDIFPDVSVDHWAYKYIFAAKANGIIQGDENGNFNPQNQISNEEIIKMIVCLIGYKEKAEQNGGYPTGYIMTAATCGVTKGLQLVNNVSAIRGDVGIMIHNALDVPIMEERTDDEHNTEWVIMNGEEEPLKTLRTKLEK